MIRTFLALRPLLHSVVLWLLAVSFLVFVSEPSRAAETLSNTWMYTTDQPPAQWNEPEFDDGDWKRGEGGFGTHGTPVQGSAQFGRPAISGFARRSSWNRFRKTQAC